MRVPSTACIASPSLSPPPQPGPRPPRPSNQSHPRDGGSPSVPYSGTPTPAVGPGHGGHVSSTCWPTLTRSTRSASLTVGAPSLSSTLQTQSSQLDVPTLVRST